MPAIKPASCFRKFASLCESFYILLLILVMLFPTCWSSCSLFASIFSIDSAMRSFELVSVSSLLFSKLGFHIFKLLCQRPNVTVAVTVTATYLALA